MDPQERGRLPLFENTALEEPGRRSLVVGLACDIVICGGVRRREPLFLFLSRLNAFIPLVCYHIHVQG